MNCNGIKVTFVVFSLAYKGTQLYYPLILQLSLAIPSSLQLCSQDIDT